MGWQARLHISEVIWLLDFKINLDEAIVVALLERSKRYNIKLKDSIRQRAKEVIERYNLTQEQIDKIYDWFTTPAAALSGFETNEQWGGNGIGAKRDQENGLDLQPDAISGFSSYPTSVCTPSKMSSRRHRWDEDPSLQPEAKAAER